MCSLGHTTVALLTSFKQVDLCWMLTWLWWRNQGSKYCANVSNKQHMYMLICERELILDGAMTGVQDRCNSPESCAGGCGNEEKSLLQRDPEANT
jgi:hypothetical protein